MKSFCLPSDSRSKKEKDTNYSKIKENQKNLSVVFQGYLSKREAFEEKKARLSKSARLNLQTSSKKSTLGWEPVWRAASFENIRPGSRESTRKVDKKWLFEVRERPCWPKTKSPSACETESSENDVQWYPSCLQRKCRSTPNVSTETYQRCKKIFAGERDLYKVRRSLKLLGLELTDFGIYSRAESGQRCKRDKSTTLATKVTGRSVSLESVRLTVKRAWTDDRLDESHRRLLARAAYEEWYFKKEKELLKKREQEKIIRMNARESFNDDFQRKKKKSEEEFKKWLLRKRTKGKGNKENLLENKDRLTETKEESQNAFRKWKLNKDKEFKKKRKEKEREEEKRNESEKQKTQKKINAEKAFQKWKSKVEEGKKLTEMKMQRKIRKQEKEEEEERKKRKEESLISFQIWKAEKDEQIKERKKKISEAERITREERHAQMEERMYEAEQAFEEWLERVDLRKEQQYSSTPSAERKIIPWIPT